MSNPIYLALDIPQIDAAKSLLNRVKPHIGGVKLGLEFFYAHGNHGVHEIANACKLPIFLDLKLHDIPNTVAAAMNAIHLLEPKVVTVHRSGGRAMMEDAKGSSKKLQGRSCNYADKLRRTRYENDRFNGNPA